MRSGVSSVRSIPSHTTYLVLAVRTGTLTAIQMFMPNNKNEQKNEKNEQGRQEQGRQEQGRQEQGRQEQGRQEQGRER